MVLASFLGVAATVLSVLAATVRADPPAWKNPGTYPANTDDHNIEHLGTIQQVDNVVYKGGSAIKVTQTYDPSWTQRYHSEVVRNYGYRRGDTAFYGFAFRLSQDWQFSPAQGYNIAQWIADFSGSGCDDWMPSSMIWLRGNQLYSRVKYGTICDQHTTEYPALATVTAGEFHRVEVQAKWTSDSTGFYKIWFDGAKVLEKYNIATTIADDRTFSFRVGLYANGWHDDKGMKGTQPFRQIWYDNLAIGSTFADADPAQWGD
ncbi:uncharacterized protein E0L32_007931 [Thyridium curvatum]|uniref:Polysaccharide lyase family 20 protein n=1 Tax=Thyridium curvatum TaxID=1093900 RepID=A0A507B3A6_9PEZI|nr:uncharacterized protein E0L32_007931 [Thyridium curvatum]TPX11070.1 hypothetical protein E0L32_007931 [Thyridium curvatum]